VRNGIEKLSTAMFGSIKAFLATYSLVNYSLDVTRHVPQTELALTW
jgi:hypothetical protein